MVHHGYPCYTMDIHGKQWLSHPWLMIKQNMRSFRHDHCECFRRGTGAASPCVCRGAGGGSPLLHGMDHGLWSMVDFPWSMDHGPFWPSFSRKNRPEYCFSHYIGPSGNSSPGRADRADRADLPDRAETVSGTTDQTFLFTDRSFWMTGVFNKLPQIIKPCKVKPCMVKPNVFN